MSNKILIVEDDSQISTMYKIKFEKEGFEVKVAEDGFAAVTLVTDYNPDVVLLDIMMPSMDGFETLRVISELAPSLNTKIVMFSNLNSQSDIDKCMRLGADAYLLKANTTPRDAVEKVNELLNTPNNKDKNKDKIYIEIKDIKKICPCCHNEISIDVIIKD